MSTVVISGTPRTVVVSPSAYAAPGPLDPQRFGVKGDVLSLGNVTVLAGQTAAASTATVLDDTAVGKTVIIEGAGTANKTHVTTIASVSGPGAFTLTDPAVTSVPNLTARIDGSTIGGRSLFGTDDTDALNAWSAACAGGLMDWSSLGACFSRTGITWTTDYTVARGARYKSHIHIIGDCDAAFHVSGAKHCAVLGVDAVFGASTDYRLNPVAHVIHLENAPSFQSDVRAFYWNGSYVVQEGASFNPFFAGYGLNGFEGPEFIGSPGHSIGAELSQMNMQGLGGRCVIATDAKDIVFGTFLSARRWGAGPVAHVRGDCANVDFGNASLTAFGQAGSVGLLIEANNTTLAAATGTTPGVTELTVAPLACGVVTPESFVIDDGAGHTVTVNTTAAAAIGDTTILVESFNPAVNFPIGSLVYASSPFRVPRGIRHTGGTCGQADTGAMVTGGRDIVLGSDYSLNRGTGILIAGPCDNVSIPATATFQSNNQHRDYDNVTTFAYDISVTSPDARVTISYPGFDSANVAGAMSFCTGNQVSLTGEVRSQSNPNIPMFAPGSAPPQKRGLVSSRVTIGTAANYTISPHERYVEQNDPTAGVRNFTLPLAASVSPGWDVTIVDAIGLANLTNNIYSILCAGSDTFFASTQTVEHISRPGGFIQVRSDGVSKWSVVNRDVPTGLELWHPGLLACTLEDDAAACSTKGIAVATQAFYRLPLRRPFTTAALSVFIPTTPAIGNTHSYLSWYDRAGVMRAQSADQSTAWQTTGLKTATLAYTPAWRGPDDWAWVCLYVGTASTAPVFASGISLQGFTNLGDAAAIAVARGVRAGTKALADTATMPDVDPSTFASSGGGVILVGVT